MTSVDFLTAVQDRAKGFSGSILYDMIAMMTRDCADRRFYPDDEGTVRLADVAALVDGRFRMRAV